MKIAAFASGLLPLLLIGLVPPQVMAAVITFDFLDLVESQSSTISGRLADGTDYSGAPLATSYEYFSWDQGLVLTASAQHEFVDPDGVGIGFNPSFVYLQPGFAGLGTCETGNCSQGSSLNYSDKVLLNFSEVVEIINIEFSIGEDDSGIPPEEDDYRAYNTLLDALGGPSGAMSDIVGMGAGWNGSLFGNQLSFFHPEGTGSYIESITVRTADVPEPATWGLLMLGLLVGGASRYRARRRGRCD